jgi:hypothetical protein
MGAILQRVQDLINLAVHESAAPEEARNSAFSAVRMIRKYGLLLKDSPQSKEASKAKGRGPKGKKASEVSAEEAPHRARAELKNLAEEKADRFVSFLVKKSIVGEFPLLSCWDLADKTRKNGEIHANDLGTFHYYLQLSLAARVKRGTLISKTGGRGGYQLRRTV